MSRQIRFRSAALLGAALAGGLALFAACKSVNHSRSAVLDDTASSGVDQCSALCADTTSTNGWSVCYSCRCKAAFDGYLPTGKDLSCANAQEIEVYSLDPSSNNLTKITSQVSECVNPPRLPDARGFGGGCNPGSRLGQLDRGDLHFKWICRREAYQANYNDPNLNFDDYGIIGHNDRNGATCYWDDKDHVTNMTNTPEIDLTDQDPVKIANFNKIFYRQEGEKSCIGCHDNDPFLYSPYFTSVNWTSTDDTLTGFYHRVQSAGGKGAIGKTLVSDAAGPCTSCHRIGAKATCGMFATDSTGQNKITSFQAFVRHNQMYGTLKTPSGKKAYLGYWMPQGSFPATADAWEQAYGPARDHIARCCKTPSLPECTWEDIPVSPDQTAAAVAPTSTPPPPSPQSPQAPSPDDGEGNLPTMNPDGTGTVPNPDGGN